MKLIEAIKNIEERERRRKGRPALVSRGRIKHQRQGMNFVRVQSVLLDDELMTLKTKTGESSIKEAVSTAVHHYLNCNKTDED